MAADTETLTAPALTPETLDELEAMTRGRRGYTIRESIELCRHVPALLSAARRTQQAEAERDAALAAEARRKEMYDAIVQRQDALYAREAKAERERDAALKRATDAEKAIRQAIEDQTKHLGQVTACAVAGSILHRGESDCTEGVIKGLEFALEALQPGAAS